MSELNPPSQNTPGAAPSCERTARRRAADPVPTVTYAGSQSLIAPARFVALKPSVPCGSRPGRAFAAKWFMKMPADPELRQHRPRQEKMVIARQGLTHADGQRRVWPQAGAKRKWHIAGTRVRRQGTA